MSHLPEILNIQYQNLPVSGSMKRFLAFHEIPTLEKLLDYRTSDLLKMKWFNARLLRELIVLLEDNGVLEKLK